MQTSLMVAALVVAAALADDCCWCGKRYFQGTPNLPPDDYLVKPLDFAVNLDKSFYVGGLDEGAVLVVHISGTDALPVSLQVSSIASVPPPFFSSVLA